MNDEYGDILLFPYPYPSQRKRMPLAARAAQFAPFSALSGYEDNIAEKSRPENTRTVLSDYQQELLNQKIHYLLESPDLHPDIIIHYFQPDPLKSGGDFGHLSGKLKQIDISQQLLLLENGTILPLDQILDIIVIKQSSENAEYQW